MGRHGVWKGNEDSTYLCAAKAFSKLVSYSFAFVLFFKWLVGGVLVPRLDDKEATISFGVAM
ncbi:hypothetical protein BDZ91DRAFT_716564, partial [Kalaharituber pfeilii]